MEDNVHILSEGIYRLECKLADRAVHHHIAIVASVLALSLGILILVI